MQNILLTVLGGLTLVEAASWKSWLATLLASSARPRRASSRAQRASLSSSPLTSLA